MLDRYPFILPILLIWLVVYLIPLILIFHTKMGLKNIKFFNRSTFMKFINLTILLFFIMILFSGVMQLLGEYKLVFNKGTNYWHAMIGFLFLLVSLNHVVIYIKTVWRYFVKAKVVQNEEK